jgi:hypothetical protein
VALDWLGRIQWTWDSCGELDLVKATRPIVAVISSWVWRLGLCVRRPLSKGIPTEVEALRSLSSFIYPCFDIFMFLYYFICVSFFYNGDGNASNTLTTGELSVPMSSEKDTGDSRINEEFIQLSSHQRQNISCIIGHIQSQFQSSLLWRSLRGQRPDSNTTMAWNCC